MIALEAKDLFLKFIYYPELDMINVKIRAQHESTVHCKPVGRGGTQIIPTVSTCNQENVEKGVSFIICLRVKHFQEKIYFFFQNLMKFCGTFVFLVEE